MLMRSIWMLNFISLGLGYFMHEYSQLITSYFGNCESFTLVLGIGLRIGLGLGLIFG